MQRTIEIADFELPRGAITIQQLMAMDRPSWEHLRGEINRRRNSDPDSPLARCRLCGGAVYIKAQATADGHIPLFAHYADAAATCPWYQGANLTPDNARAAQYQGHQECALHRWMCDTIAEILTRDPRCVKVTVDRYLRPSIEARGRYPDVYADLGDFGRFAIEIQLSKPFASEIAARHLHYEAEGVSLIWVFRDLPSDLPQGFRDVIAMQRGNAFLFDGTAFAASMEADELRLSAYLESDSGWLKPRLVALGDLDRAGGRSMFLEDRRTPRLLKYCQDARDKWWASFKEGKPIAFDDPIVEQRFASCWDSIKVYVPSLCDWKDRLWKDQYVRGRPHFLEVAAMLFSIARTAAAGQDRVYVTRYKGDGALIAMLNARLSSTYYAGYANLMAAMLAGTAARGALARSSLQTTLVRARRETTQIGPGHPVWDAATRLFPEVFDGLLRAELNDLGALPDWTAAEHHADRQAA